MKHFLSSKEIVQILEIVIHALISSRLDYCNSLYIGLPQSTLSRLQMVQNAAARFLTGTKGKGSYHPCPCLIALAPYKT